MLDADTTVYGPGARDPDDKRVAVSMKDRGLELLLFFDDLSGEGPVREVRLLPDDKELTPTALRSFMPRSALYVQYARASITFEDSDTLREMLLSLREVGATRRGLPTEFYRVVARSYDSLMQEGEQHPVKALAAMHHVTISAASRWIKEARRRGYIEEGNGA